MTRATSRGTTAPATWDTIRAAWVQGFPSVTFAELSAEHGVSRSAIAKRAKRERWEVAGRKAAAARRIATARERFAKAGEELAFARRQGVEAAAAIRRFCDAPLPPDLSTGSLVPLERLAAEAREASGAVSYVWSVAWWYANARRDLADAEAGRERPTFTPAMRDLSPVGKPVSGGKGIPGRWPWYGNGPREPYPWEKRSRPYAVRAEHRGTLAKILRNRRAQERKS